MKNKFVNVHIPKTAGSTFGANLSWAIGDYHGAGYPLINVHSLNKYEFNYEGYGRTFRELLPQIGEDGARAITGHYRYQDISGSLALMRDEVTLVTFVRDPIMRFISDYYFGSTKRNDGYEDFVSMFSCFEDYMLNDYQLKKQSNFLTPYEGADIKTVIDNAINNFDFIGITENFENDFIELMTAADLDYDLKDNENVNPDKTEMLRTFEKYKDQLRDVMSEEYELYDAILEHRNLSHIKSGRSYFTRALGNFSALFKKDV